MFILATRLVLRLRADGDSTCQGHPVRMESKLQTAQTRCAHKSSTSTPGRLGNGYECSRTPQQREAEDLPAPLSEFSFKASPVIHDEDAVETVKAGNRHQELHRKAIPSGKGGCLAAD